MEAVTVQELSRVFDGRAAVQQLTLSVERGEVFGLLGHNGAGKTTTIRLINGILRPTSGAVRVLGMDPAEEGPEVRALTGVLTETPALDDQLTVAENLEIYGAIYGIDRSALGDRVDDLLVDLDLEGVARSRAGTLSAGMKQRVALARALLHDPEVLLLDEPTSNLDPIAARQVRDLVGDLSRVRERTVVLCTHNLAEAQELCDRVAILQHGRLIALGTPEELGRSVSDGSTFVVQLSPGADGDVLRELRDRPEILDVEVVSGSLAVRGSGREAIPAVVRLLVRRGHDIYRVVDDVTTLEQAYIRLHRGEVGTSTATE